MVLLQARTRNRSGIAGTRRRCSNTRARSQREPLSARARANQHKNLPSCIPAESAKIFKLKKKKLIQNQLQLKSLNSTQQWECLIPDTSVRSVQLLIRDTGGFTKISDTDPPQETKHHNTEKHCFSDLHPDLYMKTFFYF